MRWLHLFPFILLASSALAQTTRGTIITPATPSSNPMDPNGDGKIHALNTPFSNDGYYVDEFEFKMFGIPKVDGDVPDDNQNGPGCGITDLIPDTKGYAVYALKDDNNNLIFRFRLGDNANSVESWHILLDTDGLFGAGKDLNYNADNPGFEIDITLIKKQNPGVFVTNIDGSTGCSGSVLFYPLTSNFQIAVGDVVTCGDPDYFFDIWVPFDEIAEQFNITTSTGLRFAASTSSSATCALSGAISDISGVDNNDPRYSNCESCAYEDLVFSQCPTTIENLCEECEGFDSGYPNRPHINEPILALQQEITGTAEVGSFLKLEVYQVATITSLDTTWSTTARELHVVAVAPDGKWSVMLDQPLKPFDQIVARAQLTIDGSGCDSNNANNVSSTSVTVAEPNVAPVAIAQNLSIQEDTPLSISLTATDTDPGDQALLTFSIVTQPLHGTLSCLNCPSPTYTPATDYFGADSFTFQAKDRVVFSVATTITLTITAVNDAPLAGADSFSTDEDTALNGSVAANDSDVDGPNPYWAVVSEPDHGVLTLNADGTFVYLPTTDYNGPDSFTYSLCDNSNPNLCTQASVAITIHAVNDAPIANNDSFTTNENQPLSATVATNDDATDGPGAFYTLSTVPSFGTINFGANGAFLYTPNQNYNGNDSFSYNVCDGGTPNLCNTATVSIAINQINTSPIAADDFFAMDEDSQITNANVALNDDATDGPQSLYTVITSPTHGNLLLSPDGTFSYSPSANYNGLDAFTYNLCDGANPALCSSAKVSIIINALNDAPIAVDDSFSTNEDEPLNANVSLNDNATDGPLSVYLIENAPLHGTITMSSSGVFTYTPNANYFGLDNFTYSLCDGANPTLCSPATVSISINTVNDAPIANNDSFITNEDVAITSATVASNDDATDGPSSLYSVTAHPLHGVLVLNTNGTFTFTPTENYNGTDSFDYSLCDGETPDLCSTATVSITIHAANDAPIANDDSFSTDEDTALTGANVAVNDNATDGPLSIFYISTNPTHGNVTLNSLGIFTYTPDSNYSGTDSFTYNLCDESSPNLCSTATVTLSINSVNDAPVAVNDNFSTNEDEVISTASVAINDNPTDGPTSSYLVAINPTHGLVVLGPSGIFTYTPTENYNGNDSFTYTLCDGANPALCSSATVSIVINALNDTPIATDDSFTTDEDVALINSSVASNDNGTDGPSNIYSVATPPTHGNLTLNGNGAFSYTPTANYSGADSFIYSLCDGNNPDACSQATVSITINAINDAPVITGTSLATYTFGGIPIDNSISIVDVDNTSLQSAVIKISGNFVAGDELLFTNQNSISGTYNVSTGELTLSGASSISNYATALASIVYQNDLGTSTLTRKVSFTVNDGTANSNSHNTFIDFLNNSGGPVLNNNALSVNEDETLIACLDVSDPDGDNVVISSFFNLSDGTLTLTNGTCFTFTPSTNFNGTVTVDFNLCDQATPSICQVFTVSINVNSVNDAPTVAADVITTEEDLQGSVNILANDSDPDNAINPASVDLNPSTPAIDHTMVVEGKGTFSTDGSGNVSFTPEANVNGGLSIEYTVADVGGATSQPQTISVTVHSVNDSPIASDDSFSTREDVVLNGSVSTNDTSIDGPQTNFLVLNNVEHGTLALNGNGSFVYTPAQNYFGLDGFTYTLCDGSLPNLCATAAVTINIVSENDAPIAVADNFSTNEEQALSASVALNDNLTDDGTADYSIVSNPQFGVFVLNKDGSFHYTPSTNFNGSEVFTYKICDEAGLCDQGIGTISVGAINDAPVAIIDSFTINEDIPTGTLSVAENDSDVDGPALTYTVITSPASGSITMNSDGSFNYTPNQDFNGTDSFEYTVCDGGTPEYCVQSTASITIAPVNDPPQANDTFVIVDEDGTITVQLTATDVDSNPSGFIFSIVTNPTHATVINNGGGSFTIHLNPDYFGNDSFEFVVNDGITDSNNRGMVTISVQSVNDAPVATNDNFDGVEDTPAMFNLVTNDTDVDGSVIASTIDLDPATPVEDKILTIGGQGTYTVNPNGAVTFTPIANFFGTTSAIHYTVKDNDAMTSNIGTIQVVIAAVNDAPSVSTDAVTVSEDTPEIICLAVTDVEGDASNLQSAISLDGNGSIELTPLNGPHCFRYLPNPNVFGTDRIQVTVCDVNNPNLCTTTVVNITINPVNDVPTVIINGQQGTAVTGTTNEDTPYDFCLNVLDAENDNVNISSITNIAGGGSLMVASINGSTYCFQFIPAENFTGQSQWAVSVCDDANPSLCALVTVSITVNPVQDAPIANNLTINVLEDTSADIVLDGRDPDNDLLTYSIISHPSHGKLTGTGSNVVYTPNKDYNGSDIFTYEVSDNFVRSNVAAVNITVAPANDAPEIAFIPTLTMEEDTELQICLGVTDIDSNGVTTQTPVNISGGGTITPSNDLDFCFDFLPAQDFNGEAQWEFTVCDNGNPSLCSKIVVKVVVTPKNDPPIAKHDFLTAASGELIEPYNILDNDIDVDGDALNLIITPISGPHHGSVTFNANGLITYQSTQAFIGQDSVRYRVCDSGNPQLCDEAVVFFEVDYSTFKIYEGLSPNNDDLNDYWRISGIERFPNNTVRVFDRFNNMVFETRGYNNTENNWHGQSNHGISRSNLTEGTYFYVIDLGDGSKVLSGFVILKKN